MEKDHTFVKEYYKKHIKEYGEDDIRAMAWYDDNEFLKRFEISVKIGDLNNSSILDVGCGFGNLYGFLREKGFKNYKYMGVDIVSEMIEVANKKYPGTDFRVADILKQDIENFDYVFSIGALNIKTENHEVFFKSMLSRMISISNKAVVICFLSDPEFLEEGPYYFHDPEDAKAFCENNYDVRAKIISKRNLPGESFLFIYKN